jgi:hypothetical protein
MFLSNSTLFSSPMQFLLFQALAMILLFSYVDRLQADSYSWATQLGGDTADIYGEGSPRNFAWQWLPGQKLITGTGSIARVGAGLVGAGAEYDVDFVSAGEYAMNSKSFAYGGIDNDYAFFSEGEVYARGGPGGTIDDVPDNQHSTASITLRFDDGFSSPFGTIINLVDPGAGNSANDKPFIYAFIASLHGAKIDTSGWQLFAENPYDPSQSTAGIFIWDSQNATLTYPDDSAASSFHPGWMVYIDTGYTTFDSLTLAADGFATDTFAVGLAANTASVPEPGTLSIWLIGAFGAMPLLVRRCHRRHCPCLKLTRS